MPLYRHTTASVEPYEQASERKLFAVKLIGDALRFLMYISSSQEPKRKQIFAAAALWSSSIFSLLDSARRQLPVFCRAIPILGLCLYRGIRASLQFWGLSDLPLWRYTNLQ